MLVLTRKIDEDILLEVPGLEEPILIRVIEIRHRRSVKLGIQAPREILVQRAEIVGRKRKQKGGSGEGDPANARRGQ